MIEPTEDFFPDAFEDSEAAFRRMLDRICRDMDVDADEVDLVFIRDHAQELYLEDAAGHAVSLAAAGTWHEASGRTQISISRRHNPSPIDLVGTFAHELAHHKLLGGGLLYGDEFDNELLTDLTAVFHGFGIFLGNSPRNWASQNTTWPNSRVSRPEYLSLPMYAYALAHRLWLRGERKADWMRFLSYDLRPNVRQGIAFLTKTGNSAYR